MILILFIKKPDKIIKVNDKMTNFYVENNHFKRRRVILNLRGIKYDVILKTFDKLPNSRLGKLKYLIETNNLEETSLIDICDDYDLCKNEFYFDRDPFVLNLVLNFYTSGKLHIDDNLCTMFINDELNYWLINETFISSCCEWNFRDGRDIIEKYIRKEKELIKKHYHVVEFDNFYFQEYRKKLWYLFERPSSSFFARVFKI
jgi:potassium voltage-gated channel delayed-rectifier subfamily S protein 2